MRFGSFWRRRAKPKDKAEIRYLMGVAMSPSVSIRTNLARELGAYVADIDVAAVEKESLAPVFEILTADRNEGVQVALAKAICQSKHVLPRAIILKIAAEGCERAAEILFRQSPLVSEKLMKYLVAKGGYFRQSCIASRVGISRDICSDIIAKCDEYIIELLLKNDSALIDEAGYQHLLSRFPDNIQLSEFIGGRRQLPAVISEILVASATMRMRDVAINKGWLQEQAADDMAIDLREKYTLEIAGKQSEDDVQKLVRALYKAERLSPTLILRAACVENMKFVEFGLAEISRLPLVRVTELLYSGAMGVGAVAARAGFEATLTLGLIYAFEVHGDSHSGTLSKIGFSRRMIEHVLAQGAELTPEEQRALLSLLKRFSEGDDKALATEVIEAMDKAA